MAQDDPIAPFRTPYKYPKLVLAPANPSIPSNAPPSGEVFDSRGVDDPIVFRADGRFYMLYIGFDGISTLSEEAENPKRNILLATVLVCLITGALASVEVYAAQLVWPGAQSFPDVDTAFVHVAGRAAGPWLFSLINVTLLVATVGSGMGSQLAGSMRSRLITGPTFEMFVSP